jgi:hypothetical protein
MKTFIPARIDKTPYNTIAFARIFSQDGQQIALGEE